MNFEELITSADNGNVYAQIEVGRAYELGDAPGGINYDLCYKYYLMAAEQGNSLGENNLGWCYEKGYGVEQNYEEALKWYEKSAAQNNGYGASNAAHMYLMGLGVEPDMDKALHYTIIGAQFEIPVCLYNLGHWYLIGQKVERNMEKAQQLIAAAAAKGHTMAQQMMDSCNGDITKLQIAPNNQTELQRGIDVFNAGNTEEGLAIVHNEIDKGYPNAMLLFAKMIDNLVQGERYVIMKNPQENRYAICLIDSNEQQNTSESPSFKAVVKLPQNVWMDNPDNLINHYVQEAAKRGEEEAMNLLKIKENDNNGSNMAESEEKPMSKTLLFGLVASVIGSIVACGISFIILNFYILFILCGCIVGFAVRLTGARYDNSLMVFGGIFSAISSLIALTLICLIHEGDIVGTLSNGAWIPLFIAIGIGAYQSKNNEFIDNPQ